HQRQAGTHVEHVGPPGRGRAAAQIVHHPLGHDGDEEPHVPLSAVPVKGLDDARVGEREGALLDLPEDRLVVAQDLDQDPAVVAVDDTLLDDDALDHRRFSAARRRGGRWAAATVGRWVVGPSTRLAPVLATRLPDRWSEANVPASDHQPSRISHASSPRARYQLFTSVISSSPRVDGFSVRITSNTRASYR